MKRLYQKSRWLHKYFGLLLVLFLIWMSVSGIILNHPELFGSFNVPSWMTPPAYHVKNWNRSSLIGLTYSEKNPQVWYFYGKNGVWKSINNGQKVIPLTSGFPESNYYRKTNSLLLIEGERPYLLAATDGGLYQAYLDDEQWQQIPLNGDRHKVKKLLLVKNKLYVFTDSGVFVSRSANDLLSFTNVSIPRAEKERRVTLVQLFFDLHDGKAFGLAGKILMDVIALILIFISFTGFYVWFVPWRKRKAIVKIFKPKIIQRTRTFLKYHIKIGIYVAVFFLILGGTGLFMRPPLLVALVDHDIPARYYPGFLSSNPWKEKILNALYDPERDEIILATTEGLWKGKADFSQPFEKTELNVPIFVMGPTHFEYVGNGLYRIGSFSGIYLYDSRSDRAIDLIFKRPALKISTVRPSVFMVCGYFQLPDGEQFITTHEQGLLRLNGRPAHFLAEPSEKNLTHTLSLWNWMFELHNGRLFQDLTGSFYILIIPIGSLFFLLITITGIIDWICRTFRKKSGAPQHLQPQTPAISSQVLMNHERRE